MCVIKLCFQWKNVVPIYAEAQRWRVMNIMKMKPSKKSLSHVCSKNFFNS